MALLLRIILAALLVLTGARGDDLPGLKQDKYRRLQASTERARAIVSQLENISIKQVSFQKLAPSEALNLLRMSVAGDSEGGIVNVVIRGGDEEAGKATLERASIDYAAAVDEICFQTGLNWRIDFNEESGAPILVLTKAAANKDAE